MKLIFSPGGQTLTAIRLDDGQARNLDHLRDAYGLDCDALIRAGLTIVLALLAGQLPELGGPEPVPGAAVTLDLPRSSSAPVYRGRRPNGPGRVPA